MIMNYRLAADCAPNLFIPLPTGNLLLSLSLSSEFLADRTNGALLLQCFVRLSRDRFLKK